MDCNELQHYGIKGMKWGVRRNTNRSGNTSKTGKGKKSLYKKEADRKKKRRLRAASKNRRLLSDDDIKRRMERLKLEKEFKNLTEEEISPGRKFTKDVLQQAGKKVAATVVAGAALYAVKAAMTGNFDLKEAAAYVTPKPKNK